MPDGTQRWRADAIDELLSTEDADMLFVAGCEENQAQFHDRFDRIILLTAPLDVLSQRIRTRTDNSFGKSPEEYARIVRDVADIEPLLRRAAHHTVVTTAPLSEVVTTVLRLAHET